MGHDEESPIRKAMRAFENSPAMRAIREFENSPTMRAMRDLENSPVTITKRAIEESQSMRAIWDIENSPTAIAMRQLNDSPTKRVIWEIENSPVMRLKRAIEESLALRTIQFIEHSPAMQVILEITDRLSSLNAGPLTFHEAYQEIASRYERASHTVGVDPLDIVASEVEEQVKQPSKSPLSTEFYLNLIITLIIFMYSQTCSNNSEKLILNRIEKLEYVITQKLSELKACEEVDTFYVVERTTYLRTGPTTQSKTLVFLYPNLKLRLIERSAKWIKVEYFDYLEGAHKSGWVNKKYLKIMNPKNRK